jgi:tetratricopeptide (TPR) repeat protein
LAARCREVCDARADLAVGLAGQPAAWREERWRADLLDAAVLAAELGVRAAGDGDVTAARTRALADLDAAERQLGPGVALDLERARHARGLGRVADADAWDARAVDRPRRGVWDYLAAGRSYLAAGDDGRAAAEFDRAAARDPSSAWAHYYRGVGLLRLGRATEAVAAFSSCAALAPRAAWCAYNRGLAFAAAGEPDAARAEFDRAVELDPAFAAAYLSRASVHHTSGRPADALADLKRAAGAGASAADVGYRTAVVRLGTGDRTGAVESLRACLHDRPDHPEAAALLHRLLPGRVDP